jgi:uncharacterized membrane protein YedE/YeeE
MHKITRKTLVIYFVMAYVMAVIVPRVIIANAKQIVTIVLKQNNYTKRRGISYIIKKTHR